MVRGFWRRTNEACFVSNQAKSDSVLTKSSGFWLAGIIRLSERNIRMIQTNELETLHGGELNSITAGNEGLPGGDCQTLSSLVNLAVA